jgi:hypothetical protein
MLWFLPSVRIHRFDDLARLGAGGRRRKPGRQRHNLARAREGEPLPPPGHHTARARARHSPRQNDFFIRA